VFQTLYTLYIKNYFKKNEFCQALVAHACTPSYSGGRDQEDCGSKPALANGSQDPISKKKKKKLQKRADGVAQM
jgi:hypothetical protein